MNNIIVAFPKEELARNIKKILAQSGYSVIAVCTTGASALEHVNGMDSGILVCGYRFVDMMYLEIYEYLPKGFQMLLIASLENVSERGMDNLVTLATPLKVHELLQTIEMMDYTVTRYKKKQRQRPKIRSDEEQSPHCVYSAVAIVVASHACNHSAITQVVSSLICNYSANSHAAAIHA